MNKAQLREKIEEVAAKYALPQEAIEELLALVASKGRGRRVSIEEVLKEDKKGNKYLLDPTLNLYLPASIEVFYEDKAGKGIEIDGIHLKRHSRIAEKLRKEWQKHYNQKKAEIMAAVLDGAITPEDAKAQLAELEANKPDFYELGKEYCEQNGIPYLEA